MSTRKGVVFDPSQGPVSVTANRRYAAVSGIYTGPIPTGYPSLDPNKPMDDDFFYNGEEPDFNKSEEQNEFEKTTNRKKPKRRRKRKFFGMFMARRKADANASD